MPDFDLENACRGHEDYLIAGVDEAGRGPWAGPVTAAAVIWPPTGPPSEVARLIDDSKALSAAKRRVALREIEQHALIAVGWATVAEIDEHNILAATFMAMRRAIDAISKQMGRPIDLALVDGNRAPDLPCTVRTVIKGDAKSYSIAAASIVAKEARDRIGAETPRLWLGAKCRLWHGRAPCRADAVGGNPGASVQFQAGTRAAACRHDYHKPRWVSR
jgi:ribonuclease HII